MSAIGIALDFSNVTPHVLREGAVLAKCSRKRVLLIHVVETTPFYELYDMTREEAVETGPDSPEFMEAVKKKLEWHADMLRGEGLVVESIILQGSPSEKILHYIRENGLTTLVVGTHGHGILSSMLMGSVSDRLVRKSEIPVLVVPYSKKA